MRRAPLPSSRSRFGTHRAALAPTSHNTQGARWAWAGILLGTCLALVTQAPAQWLAQGVARASAGRVVLNNPQGTVWNGSAQWVLSDGQAKTSKTQSADVALPTRVHWQWRPSWHPTDGLALALHLHASCCTPEPLSLSIAPLWRGVSVRVADHHAQWPAHWLVGLGAPWNTLQAEGQLQLSTQQLQLTVRSGTAQLSGQAQLDVMQLSTRLSTLRPLGNYRVVLSGGDTIGIKLDTLEGGLQLQGQGQWLNQRLSFRGEASAQPEFEAALSNLLNVLGQRQGAKSIMELS